MTHIDVPGVDVSVASNVAEMTMIIVYIMNNFLDDQCIQEKSLKQHVFGTWRRDFLNHRNVRAQDRASFSVEMLLRRCNHRLLGLVVS